MILHNILPRNFPRDIWALFATSVISAVGFSITMPYMSLYLNNVLKIPMTMVGVILMTAQITGATLGLYGGELSDRFGRKFIMVRSLAGRFLLFIFIGITIMEWHNIYLIFIFLILNSILFSFYMPASQAYIADLTKENERLKAYGLLRMGINLGWALGPAAGGLLATIDYAYLFFVTAFCMLIATAVLTIFCKESLNHGTKGSSKKMELKVSIKEIFSVINDHKFFTFTLISLSIFIVWGQLVSPLSIYAVNRIGITKSQLGILFSINGFIVVFFQYFVTHLIPDKKEISALMIGSLVYGVGYLSIGFASGFTSLIISIVIITIAEMIITPSSQSYASKIAPAENRGRYLAFYNLSQTFGWALGPLLGGILLDLFSGRSIFIWGIVSLIALFSTIGFMIFKTNKD
ncbi:MAG: MFS transporter [candidate division WOR-3 bacterium]|nr:MFS transporter [candidate division WOR-3 bacterium]